MSDSGVSLKLFFMVMANPNAKTVLVTAVGPTAARVQLSFYSLYIQEGCAPSGQRMRDETFERQTGSCVCDVRQHRRKCCCCFVCCSFISMPQTRLSVCTHHYEKTIVITRELRTNRALSHRKLKEMM